MDETDSGDVEVEDCSGEALGCLGAVVVARATLCGVGSSRFMSSASDCELVTTLIGLMKLVEALVLAASPLVYLLITESTRSSILSLNAGARGCFESFEVSFEVRLLLRDLFLLCREFERFELVDEVGD